MTADGLWKNPPRAFLPSGVFRLAHAGRLAHTSPRSLIPTVWEIETLNSKMKRNLGSELRGKTADSRKRDMLLKVLVHDLMVL